jgi:peroxiredoxin Q/BCP
MVTAKKASVIPTVGSIAPDFQLPDQHGHLIKLSKMRKNRVLIYFYPKDDTPGCTLEAQGFSADVAKFQKKGVMVFGISKDDAKSHCKFIDKYKLQFQLLTDDGKTIEAYGCWVEKSMYGRKYMGIQRATFLIGKDGRIEKVWPNVTPEGHSKEVLAAL